MLSVRKSYLLAYNAFMLAEWGLVALRVIQHFRAGGKADGVFAAVRERVRRLLFLSCMEIVHAAIGTVKAPVGPTAVQCLVRLGSFVGAMDLGSKAVEASHWPAQTLLAWTASEVIRYAFYAWNQVQDAPRLLTWLRYSAFVALYPLGISGEMGCFATAIPFVRDNGTFSAALPNAYNAVFDYASAIKFALVFLYPPGAYKLYTYMLGQRRKVLSKP